MSTVSRANGFFPPFTATKSSSNSFWDTRAYGRSIPTNPETTMQQREIDTPPYRSKYTARYSECYSK
jgi:hypothetical protein